MIKMAKNHRSIYNMDALGIIAEPLILLGLPANVQCPLMFPPGMFVAAWELKIKNVILKISSRV